MGFDTIEINLVFYYFLVKIKIYSEMGKAITRMVRDSHQYCQDIYQDPQEKVEVKLSFGQKSSHFVTF